MNPFKRVRLWWWQWQLIQKTQAGVVCPELRLLWRGEYDAARTHAQATDPRSRFHLACIELEAGRVDDARACLARLPSADPAREVLDRLITTRSNLTAPPLRALQAEPSWLRGLERAWRDAASPDLRDHPWLGPHLEKSCDVGAPTADFSDDDRMAWLRMTWQASFLSRREPRALRRWATANRPDVAARDLSALVLAAAHFDERDDPNERLAALRAVLRAVPTNVCLRLAVLGVRAHRRFADDEVTQLEAADTGTDLDAVGVDSVYERAEHVARKAGSGSAELLALRMAYASLILPDLAALFAGLRHEPEPGRRRRIARALGSIGQRLRGGTRQLIVRFVGNAMAREAAMALGDQQAIDEALHVQAQAVAAVSLDQHLRFDPARWPLPSVAREAIAEQRRSEVAYVDWCRQLSTG